MNTNRINDNVIATELINLWEQAGLTLDRTTGMEIITVMQRSARKNNWNYGPAWEAVKEYLHRLTTLKPGDDLYPRSLAMLTYLTTHYAKTGSRAAGAKNGLPATPAPRNIDWASQGDSTLASSQPENMTTGWTMEVRGRSATNEATTEWDKATSQRVAHLDSIKTRLQAAKETVRPLAGHVATEKEISQLAGVVMMSPQEEWEPALTLWVSRRETRQPGDSFYPSNGNILEFYMRLAREENEKAC